MSNHLRRGGATALIVVLSAIMLGMLFILFYGTGVFRNWGKRGQEQEAEVALYKALQRLDEGKMGDMSLSFQAHEAGRAARDLYRFLREDMREETALDKALALIPSEMPKDVSEAKRILPAIKQAVLDVYDARQAREIRSGKFMLAMKALAPTSDRLNARYQRMIRQFEDADNIYGGPDQLLDLRMTRLRKLQDVYEFLIKQAGKWRNENGQVVFSPAGSKEEAAFQALQAQIGLTEREFERVEHVVATATVAERESTRRRLGL